ncbi:MAG: hypothetical protein AAF628_19035 [Planctomycetota bacterium]
MDGRGRARTATAASVDMGAHGAVLTADGGFAYSGFRKLPLGSVALILAKLDALGSLQWAHEYDHVLTIGQLLLPEVPGAEAGDGGFALAAGARPLRSQVLLRVGPGGAVPCASTPLAAETSYPIQMAATLPTETVLRVGRRRLHVARRTRVLTGLVFCPPVAAAGTAPEKARWPRGPVAATGR